MTEVTGFVLRDACRAIVTGAPETWTLSVNVTAADAGRDELVNQVSAALETSGLPPQRLTLEVTETGLLSNYRESARVLGRLKELGVAVSLDDFGTGYSSLRLLRELPIAELKVDAVFVADVETSAPDAAIISNIIRLADAFGASVVAEGVERLSQTSMLQQLGCQYAQGFLWSRPAPLWQILAVGEQAIQRRPRARPAQIVTDRISALMSDGASPHSVAAALNADGLRTPDGKRWHAASVAQLLRDLGR
jgi:EAL domain-containing protein (putative c-di-GMP-specific phosphodiesterase class I)